MNEKERKGSPKSASAKIGNRGVCHYIVAGDDIGFSGRELLGRTLATTAAMEQARCA